MLILLFATLLPTPSQSTAPSGSQPSMACFERLADAEGEMDLARDPVWRKKALRELARMRARTGEYYAEVDADLAENRRSRAAGGVRQRRHGGGRLQRRSLRAGGEGA